MNDPFNKHIYEESDKIYNNEGSNYILEEIQTKDLDQKLLEIKATKAKASIANTAGITSSIGGVIPAVVTMIATITIITAILINAPRVDFDNIEVLHDRIILKMSLEETTNPYILKLSGNDFTYYDELDDVYYENVIIGLSEDETYELVIINDYGAGETVLKKVIFETPNKDINNYNEKIIVENINVLNNQLNISLMIDDPYNYLYDFKLIIFDEDGNEVKYGFNKFKDNINIDIERLNKGIFTIKIYSKSNKDDEDNNDYILKTIYKGRK